MGVARAGETAPPSTVCRIDGVDLRAGDRVRLRPRRAAAISSTWSWRARRPSSRPSSRTTTARFISPSWSTTTRAATSGCCVSPAIGSSSRPTRSSRSGWSAERRQRFSSPASATSFWATTGSASRSCSACSQAALPRGVRVVDFGIRGLDLAYALVDAPDVTILVDAMSARGAPGHAVRHRAGLTGGTADADGHRTGRRALDESGEGAPHGADDGRRAASASSWSAASRRRSGRTRVQLGSERRGRGGGRRSGAMLVRAGREIRRVPPMRPSSAGTSEKGVDCRHGRTRPSQNCNGRRNRPRHAVPARRRRSARLRRRA